jgi:hypothetical protein
MSTLCLLLFPECVQGAAKLKDAIITNCPSSPLENDIILVETTPEIPIFKCELLAGPTHPEDDK